MYCSNCGHKISETSKFCPSCGKEIQSGDWETSTDNVPKRPKKKLLKVMIVLFALFFCAALIAFALIQFSPLQDSVSLLQSGEDSSEIEESILQAEQYAADGNYLMAIEVLQEKNAEFGPNEALESKLQDVQEAYAEAIAEQAQEALDQGAYTEAIQLLDDALTALPEHETLSKLQQEAERLSQETENADADTTSASAQSDEQEDTTIELESTATYTALPAQFKTYKGSIEQDDETDQYQFSPEVTGTYRLDFSNMVSGFSVRLRIYDEFGEELERSWSIGNGSGLTAELTAGQSYTISVEETSGTGDYTLTVGMQKETVDISDYDMIADSTEYTEQTNVYTFTPQNTGIYRFELSEVQSGVEMRLELFDALNYSIEYDWVGNGGISAELQAGMQYTLEVKQSQDMGQYLMHIGKQQATVDLSEGNTVKDAITFNDQVNYYTFTPKSSDEYTIGIGGLQEDFEVYVTVTDSLGYDVEYDWESENDAKMLTLSLEQGENYSIAVAQRTNQGNYQIAIHKN